eukprot:34949_1
MSTTTRVNLDELTVDTTIELLWPPSGQWQTGTITHVWGNGEFAIQFEDDPFDEPLSYRLESYDFRVLSKAAASNTVKTEKKETEPVKSSEPQPQPSIEEKQTETADATDATATPQATEATQEGEATGDADEIEAVIDYVSNETEEHGDIFNVYRIKWKGFGLSDATWEPKDHLNDASEMIDRYNRQINDCNPNSSNIRNVRRSPFDNNLLHDLWNILGQDNDQNNTEYGVTWASEGRAFQVNDIPNFVAHFLSRNKHNIIDETNYDSFSQRMTVLGFEQEKESRLYHHPCFNKQSNKLIESIGKNSIPLPDDEEKAALFKSRVLKEKQEQTHPVIDELPIHETDGSMMNNAGRKRNRMEMQGYGGMNGGDDMKKRKMNGLSPEMSNYNYGLFVPIESNLDLNQCHLWTEHEVAEWIRHLPDWGNYYAAKFIENGVDGRILLEFDDLELVIKEADIQPIHKATFIYGVNTLRSVRRKGIEQMKQSQGM